MDCRIRADSDPLDPYGVPVTDTTWDLSELSTGAQIFDGAGEALSSLSASVHAPNPAMYGRFVSNAAAMTEPATSTAHRHLLTALSSSATDVGDRLRATEEAYRAVEEANTALVRTITSALEEVVR
jgi:hypothetical protein